MGQGNNTVNPSTEESTQVETVTNNIDEVEELVESFDSKRVTSNDCAELSEEDFNTNENTEDGSPAAHNTVNNEGESERKSSPNYQEGGHGKEGGAASDTSELPPKKKSGAKTIVAALVLIGAGAGGYYWQQQSESGQHTSTIATSKTAIHATPEKELEVSPSNEAMADNKGFEKTASVPEAVQAETRHVNDNKAPEQDASEPEAAQTETTVTETSSAQADTSAPKVAQEEAAAPKTTVTETSSAQVEQAQTSMAEQVEVGVPEQVPLKVMGVNKSSSTADLFQENEKAKAEVRLAEQAKQIEQLTIELEHIKENNVAHQAFAKARRQEYQLFVEAYFLASKAYDVLEQRSLDYKNNSIALLRHAKGNIEAFKNAKWQKVILAIDADIDTIQKISTVDQKKIIEKLNLLKELLEKASFISPEAGVDLLSQGNLKIASPDVATASTPATESSWVDRTLAQAKQWPKQVYDEVRGDFWGMIRVEKLANPEVATLSVQEIKNKRAKILGDVQVATSALLMQEESYWREYLQKIEQAINDFYDLNTDTAQHAKALAKELLESRIKENIRNEYQAKAVLEQVISELGSSAHEEE